MKLRLRWSGHEVELAELQRAYRDIPDEVWRDLADFTKAYHVNGTFDKDPYEHAKNEGRRQVFQRMMNHAKLDYGQLMLLYQNYPINLEKDK
jgi:hypothetical protein